MKLNTEVRGNATFSFILPPGFLARVDVDARRDSPENINMTIYAPELDMNESLILLKYEKRSGGGGDSPIYDYENEPFEFENNLNKEITYEVVLQPEDKELEYGVGIYHNYNSAISYGVIFGITIFLAVIFFGVSVTKRESDYFIHFLVILSNILLWLVYTSILLGFSLYLNEVAVPAP